MMKPSGDVEVLRRADARAPVRDAFAVACVGARGVFRGAWGTRAPNAAVRLPTESGFGEIGARFDCFESLHFER